MNSSGHPLIQSLIQAVLVASNARCTHEQQDRNVTVLPLSP